MKRFDRYLLAGAAAVLAVLTGCTTVDDSLGANIVPDNQQMKTGYVEFPRKDGNGRPIRRTLVRTRLVQTDSIVSSKTGYGYIGSQLNDTLGVRTAGFLTQYLDGISNFEPGMFGYRPFVDSVQLLMTIDRFGRDTLTPQRYEIYEVTDNAFLKERTDTTFYFDFKAEKYIGNAPLFSFSFPNERIKNLKSSTVTLKIEQAGEQLLRRLLLQEGTYKDNYSIYSVDSMEHWMDEFKGLYIRPARNEEQTQTGKGGIYGMDLTKSGLVVYGRNRMKEDPSLVKDTLLLEYLFYDSSTATKFGNVSVNTLERDYTKGSFFSTNDEIREPAPGQPDTRPERNHRVMVEGMGGVATEITFAPEFFAELQSEIDRNNAGGEDYKTLAFSRVRMMIYFTDADHDWQQTMLKNPDKLMAEMDTAPERIGLYTDYKKLTPIIDYNYTYEKNYDAQLAYGGNVNRSRGCYTMDITGYVQMLWNVYAAERDAAKAENREIDLEKVKNRTIYAAPEAYGLYTSDFCVLQGMDDALNDAPIRFEVLYNLVK